MIKRIGKRRSRRKTKKKKAESEVKTLEDYGVSEETVAAQPGSWWTWAG